MPDKLTDSEIVKALECCSTYKGKCTDCPAFVKVDRSNCKQVLLGAIEIINRLQAENERLKENLNIDLENFATEYDNKIKAEAYKEFADKVCDEITDAIINNGKVIKERIEKHNVNRLEDNFCCMCDGKIMALGGIEYFIKNLLKELVGDGDV
jgi:hypothetical protein